MSKDDEHTEGVLETLTRAADAVDAIFNGEGTGGAVGFCLMTFPLGSGGDGRCNYISNAGRGEVLALLKEQVRFFEEEATPEDQLDVMGHA